MPRYDDAELFDGIQVFFDALKVESLKDQCYPKAQYSAEVLKARGFLLEDGELALSDNSHRHDATYLNLLLQRDRLGEVIDGKIFLRPDANVEKIFYRHNRIGGEALCNGYGWEKFVRDTYAPKVAVSDLEPFIARYVKAISACSVNTWLSCHGNHLERNSQRILIDFTSKPDRLWHEIICKRLLDGRFNLNRDNEYSKIEFDKSTKWQTYIEINRAGKFLYNNRIKIRQIRREAARGIRTCMARRLSDEELTEIFSERANKLFDDFCKEL